MLLERVRSMATLHWLTLLGGILVAWLALWIMAVPADLRAAASLYGADFWVALCSVGPDGGGYFGLVAMWTLMAGGMMAPTALPALATYDDLGRSAATNFWALVMGYMAVWMGFAFIAAGLQIGLYHAGLVDMIGTSVSPVLSGALLVSAGLYQFSSLKEACLSRCRAPLTFFMAHWDEGPWRLGLRLGATCLGCCAALMLLAFVGGVMSLGFMALGMVLMTLEKLPQIGRWMTMPLGVALIATGFWTLLHAI